MRRCFKCKGLLWYTEDVDGFIEWVCLMCGKREHVGILSRRTRSQIKQQSSNSLPMVGHVGEGSTPSRAISSLTVHNRCSPSVVGGQYSFHLEDDDGEAE